MIAETILDRDRYCSADSAGQQTRGVCGGKQVVGNALVLLVLDERAKMALLRTMLAV